MPDRAAIVTGASRGIGRALAEALGQEGFALTVTARKPEPLEQAADELRGQGYEVEHVAANMADEAAIQEVVRRHGERFGRLDVLVNNAGFLRDRMVVSTSEQEWDAVVRVHLKGHFCPTRHATGYWRDLAKTGEPVDARIINTSSGAGLMGSVGQASYSAAKAGIAALTLVEAAELARYGVTANAIAPAARTRMTEATFAETMARPDEGFDAMAPENVSPLVVWLGSAESRDVTGRVFEVEGGIIGVADGWQHGPRVDKGARWDPADVGAAVREVLAKAPTPAPVYGAADG
jgi:NAD(P)-dependent dehydrogenase (short-subunit alcohol dehydrogenase family)